MPSDRDRLSYDEKQQYRSVVAQQGRVTVPADFNEAQEIFAEEQRKEALDIVGLSGTPDDGYKVGFPSPNPNFDLQVGAGTMYVGGMCVSLAQPIQYFAQPDWIDPPAPTTTPPQNEYIYLYLQEQEISAVEDQSLKDRALGGPDTTQRTRLLQHIVRADAGATTCPEALEEQVKGWAKEGLAFRPDTMRLNSASTLLVGFDNTGTTPDPCDPTVSGGYLGAENQLIRVRISAPGKFVWGFDNASFLYRVDVVDNQTIKLQSPPVDAFHHPRIGQTIQLLRTEASLSNGEFIAYDVGRVDVLAEPYNADSQTIRLPEPLTNDLIPPNGTPRLFLRVWEERKTFEPGVAVSLGSTGVNVTLDSSGEFNSGDFWAFAVRPSSPAEVYPARYTSAGQPPDGPRRWACPLAVIKWTVIGGNVGGVVLKDCRNPFDNLVELTKRRGGGCCTLALSPNDQITLADAVNQLAGQTEATICLAPGTYTLKEPLTLNEKHSGLTIEGCHDEVAIVAAKDGPFLHGMFILDHADDITLRGLSFHLPLGSAAELPIAMKPDELRFLNSFDVKRLLSGIGVRAFGSHGLTVERCQFHLQTPPPADHDAFGVAILLGGDCDRLIIRNNRFVREKGNSLVASDHYEVSFGIAMAPVSRVTPKFNGQLVAVEGSVLPAILQQAAITNNFFSGVSAAGFFNGDLGDIRVEDNTVRESASGFWALSSLSLSSVVFTPEIISKPVMAEPVILIGASLARGYPWPNTLRPADEKIDVPPEGAGVPTADLPPVLLQGFILNFIISIGMERNAFSARPVKTPFSLVCAQNRLDAFSGEGVALQSRTGLVAWGPAPSLGIIPKPSSAVISANQIRSIATLERFPWPTAVLILLGETTITGNLILNEGPINGSPLSLVLLAGPPGEKAENVAVTGNVFLKPTMLPPRRDPPHDPLDLWETFNAVFSR